MNNFRPFIFKPRSISAWLAAGVGAFVLVGSIAMMGFFQHLNQVEERVALESLGRTNALFLDQSKLPQSKHMADQLGRVMGAEVTFSTPPAHGSNARRANGQAQRMGEVIQVGFPLKSGNQVWFSRSIRLHDAKAVWKRLDARLALLAFWTLSLLFAFGLGRKITRPLARLGAALPNIGGEKPLKNLPSSGPAEIVNLATALSNTHSSLIEERRKRRHAERLALLGRMATSLAHEVRNPVTAIRLHAQLLERSCAPSEKTSVNMIFTEAGRIESMVNQWLRYAKPEPVKSLPVDLASLLQQVLQALTPQADHTEVTLSLEIDPAWQETPVKGDSERLHQVFSNLLLNAIQSMPSGGTVRVRILAGSVEISDQGNGFSPSALANFGEPFHSEREGGMGLGLAVSKEIIESHGASLKAENSDTSGAIVRITWSKPDSSSHGKHPDH